MALQSLQLTAAITASQLTWPVTSTAAFPPVGTPFVNQAVLCDGEYAVCVGVPAVNVITVRSRGNEGTVATPHDVLANVYTTANNADWGPVPPAVTVQNDPSDDATISIGQDSTIIVSAGNAAYNINKATAAAITLAAPLLLANGTMVVFTSQTAAAHVITATGLFMDGTSGAPKSTATFAAFKGASLTLVAENGFWNVSAAPQGVTLS
jgi:hypothetical protein